VNETDPHRPLVSICLPVYNGEAWVARALESALAQTYEPLEIVVSDNASTDGTAELVRSYGDPRVRISTAAQRATMSGNHNRAVQLSRGPFVKFLHADDVLLPGCVDEMVAVALEDEEIGLVFAPRQVELEHPDSADDQEWERRYGSLHTRFHHLQRINEGPDLLRQLVAADVEENWIGEPTSVLVRRSALDAVGCFNVRITQRMDLELWMRILSRYKVGFVDRPLSVYRHHSASTTAANAQTANDATDNVWLFDTLLSLDGMDFDRRHVRRLRRIALKRALGAQARRLRHLRFGTQLPAYVLHHARRRPLSVNWTPQEIAP
jgi:cellulose synthase/poly-beta-1,6-N-acetylglucosamine synthase-like glycosyltransferase